MSSLTKLSIAMICGIGNRYVSIQQWQNYTEREQLIC